MQMNSELNSDFEKKKLFQNFVLQKKKHFFRNMKIQHFRPFAKRIWNNFALITPWFTFKSWRNMHIGSYILT